MLSYAFLKFESLRSQIRKTECLALMRPVKVAATSVKFAMPGK